MIALADRSRIIALLNYYADKYRVPRTYVHAIARIESGHQQLRDGRTITSSAGALGVMQLMPGTARGLGVNPHDVEENIEGGVRYFRQRLDLSGGDPSMAVAMYYAGVGNVRNRNAMRWEGVQRYIRNFNALINNSEIMAMAGGRASAREVVENRPNQPDITNIGNNQEQVFLIIVGLIIGIIIIVNFFS